MWRLGLVSKKGIFRLGVGTGMEWKRRKKKEEKGKRKRRRKRRRGRKKEGEGEENDATKGNVFFFSSQIHHVRIIMKI